MLTSKKVFRGYPFAHRQHNHSGHCRLIHGHNWDFTFEFRAGTLDANGFVIDFGKLDFIKSLLEDMFDHTLVLNNTDPMRAMLEECLLGPPSGRLVEPLAKIRVVEDSSTEGLAAFLLEHVGRTVTFLTTGRVWVQAVTVAENDRNSSTAEIE